MVVHKLIKYSIYTNEESSCASFDSLCCEICSFHVLLFTSCTDENKAPPRCHKNTTLENACSIFTKTESPRARIIPKIPAKAMLFVFKIRKSTLKKDESLLWYCFVKSTKEQLERHGFIQKARRLVQFNKLFHESPPKKTFAF